MALHRLREIRLARKLTLQELADGVAISIAQLSRAERGERDLRLEVLMRIATRLGVPMSDLTGEYVPVPVSVEPDAVAEKSTPGQRLREARIAVGLTQTELAERISATQSQVQKLEANKRSLSKSWAERVAPVLETTAMGLLFGDEASVRAEARPGEDDEVDALRRENAELRRRIDVLLETVEMLARR